MHLGVAWYLYPDEDNGDGKFTAYPKLKECDHTLYGVLTQLVDEGNRSVAAVRRSGILPSDTTYYEECLSYPRNEKRSSRECRRKIWLDGALDAAKEADVIFVDPDNGISVTASPFQKNGPKFVFVDDLRCFFQRGKSLIIYHHLGRNGTAKDQIDNISKRLMCEIELSSSPWALWYHRGTARAYFIIPHQDNIEPIL